MSRRKWCKCVRVDVEALKNEIVAQFGTLARANEVLHRSHDYLHGYFRTCKVEMPIDVLDEIGFGLGIDYEPFRKRNNVSVDETAVVNPVEHEKETVPDEVIRMHDFEKELCDKFVQLALLAADIILQFRRYE